MILVYSNKPFFSRTIKEHLLSSLADNYYKDKIVFIHQLLFTNVNFKYPKELTWKDYPYIKEPEYKLEMDLKKWMPLQLNLTEIELDEVKNVKMENCDDITWNDIINVKEVIFLGDISKTEIHDFKVFSDLVYGKRDTDLKRTIVILKNLYESEVQEAWNNRIHVNINFEEYNEDIKKERIKKYFDFNYNINSMGILGRTLKLSGIDQNKFFLSKYTLQFLYYLKGIDLPQSEGALINFMHKWKGTGAYSEKVYFGSEISRAEIISGMYTGGLLLNEDGKGKKVIKTEKVEILLKNLHKDCKDLDLPFRIQNWKGESFLIARDKMNVYLSKFFGKQKRKLDKKS